MCGEGGGGWGGGGGDCTAQNFRQTKSVIRLGNNEVLKTLPRTLTSTPRTFH